MIKLHKKFLIQLKNYTMFKILRGIEETYNYFDKHLIFKLLGWYFYYLLII